MQTTPLQNPSYTSSLCQTIDDLGTSLLAVHDDYCRCHIPSSSLALNSALASAVASAVVHRSGQLHRLHCPLIVLTVHDDHRRRHIPPSLSLALNLRRCHRSG